jgi:hypothetical protein
VQGTSRRAELRQPSRDLHIPTRALSRNSILSRTRQTHMPVHEPVQVQRCAELERSLIAAPAQTDLKLGHPIARRNKANTVHTILLCHHHRPGRIACDIELRVHCPNLTGKTSLRKDTRREGWVSVRRTGLRLAPPSAQHRYCNIRTTYDSNVTSSHHRQTGSR